MGTGLEAAALPALLGTLGGGVMQYMAQRSAMKQQDRELVRRLRTQQANQRLADAQVRDLVSKQAASGPQGEIDQAKAMFMEQLKANAGQSTGGLSQISGASDAYKDSAERAAMGIADYGADRADTVARITGPGAQRDREARERAQYGSNLEAIIRNAKGDDFLSELRMGRIQPSPWMMLLGQGLQQFSAGGGFGGFGTKSSGSNAIKKSVWGDANTYKDYA